MHLVEHMNNRKYCYFYVVIPWRRKGGGKWMLQVVPSPAACGPCTGPSCGAIMSLEAVLGVFSAPGT